MFTLKCYTILLESAKLKLYKEINAMDEEILKSCSCPLDATIAVIGGKYKIDIVYYLVGRTLRYSQLAKLVAATPKMLAEQLKELEKDGIINRVMYPVVPPKTEYSLTELGNKLVPCVFEMYKFGHELYNVHEVKPRCGCNEDLSRLEEALKNK
jgi:DNA-binding HxlR family transcriptional regulator